jgi:uncharacterized protein YihD (DUF1040 family)
MYNILTKMREEVVVMRDPNRIDHILNLLKQMWKQVPDWRLGQLLINLTYRNEDLYYLEDDKLEERLEAWLRIVSK